MNTTTGFLLYSSIVNCCCGCRCHRRCLLLETLAVNVVPADSHSPSRQRQSFLFLWSVRRSPLPFHSEWNIRAQSGEGLWCLLPIRFRHSVPPYCHVVEAPSHTPGGPLTLVVITAVLRLLHHRTSTTSTDLLYRTTFLSHFSVSRTLQLSSSSAVTHPFLLLRSCSGSDHA